MKFIFTMKEWNSLSRHSRDLIDVDVSDEPKSQLKLWSQVSYTPLDLILNGIAGKHICKMIYHINKTL